jgi:hypothetical protein
MIFGRWSQPTGNSTLDSSSTERLINGFRTGILNAIVPGGLPKARHLLAVVYSAPLRSLRVVVVYWLEL